MSLLGVHCPRCGSKQFYGRKTKSVMLQVTDDAGVVHQRESMNYVCRKCMRSFYEHETPRWRIMNNQLYNTTQMSKDPEKRKVERKELMEKLFGKPKSSDLDEPKVEDASINS